MKPLQQFIHLLKFQLWSNLTLFVAMIVMVWISRQMVAINMQDACLPWSSYPGAFNSFVAFYFVWILLFGVPSNSANGNALFSLKGPYVWTRSLDRRLIPGVMIFIYVVAVAIMIQPGLTHLMEALKTAKPLQISFQSPDDNASFQQALLANHRLGAFQFYDKWKRIIIEIPHGREYRIGLWLFQILTTILLLLWLGMGLNLPNRWRKLLPIVFFFIVLGPPFLRIFLDFFSTKHSGYTHDFFRYGDQFLLYANYHLWLWVGLAMAAILIFRSLSKNFLPPSS